MHGTKMETAQFFCTIPTALTFKILFICLFYHYHYFIKLGEYVAKLIGMLLPVIWSSMSEPCYGIIFLIELTSFNKIFLGKKYTCRSLDWKWKIWSIFASICSQILFSNFSACRIFCPQKRDLLWITRTGLCHNTVHQLQWDIPLAH